MSYNRNPNYSNWEQLVKRQELSIVMPMNSLKSTDKRLWHISKQSDVELIAMQDDSSKAIRRSR